MAMKNWLPGLRLRAQGLRVWVLQYGIRGLGVWGFRSSELRINDSGVQNLGFTVQGFRVWGRRAFRCFISTP